GCQIHVFHLVVLAVEGKVLLGEASPYQLHSLLDPSAALTARNAEAVELANHVALANAQVEPPFGQDIDRRCVLGDADRMMKGQNDDEGSQADAAGALRDG